MIVNNHGKFIFHCSAKTSYLLLKNINGKYNEKYLGIKHDHHNKIKNDPYIANIDYTHFLFLRNPFTRVVSSYYSISHAPNFKYCNQKYDSFEDFINILHEEVITNKPFILKDNHIKQQTKQLRLGILEKCPPAHVFETTQLNDFIKLFNKMYDINFPIGKYHSFKYKNEPIKNAHLLSKKDMYVRRPKSQYLLTSPQLNAKIREIFAGDFALGKKHGYNFTEKTYI